MSGDSGRRAGCEGRECRGRESGGAGGEIPSLPSEERLCTGMTSGVAAGITSGGICDEGGMEGVAVKAAPSLGMMVQSAPASLGVEMWLLSYVSSVTWTENEVLEGEVREHDSQEQLV